MVSAPLVAAEVCLCHLKEKSYAECVKQCDRVLRLTPACEKTLRRRAEANPSPATPQQFWRRERRCPRGVSAKQSVPEM